MAPSTTLIRISPATEGTQLAVSAWLDLVTRSVQTGSRKPALDAGQADEASLATRSRILQQAAAAMLAPVERRPRVLGDLLR